MTIKTWHVLGAGAIGCLFADQLTQLGYQVVCITRESKPTTRTIRITKKNELLRLLRVDCLPANQASDISNLVVCTKAYQACEAVKSVLKGLSENSQIITLHNGLGPQYWLKQKINARVFAGTTTHGANKPNPNTLLLAGTGQCFVGALNSTPPPKDLPGCFEVVQDIEDRLWNKLIVNCLINPLTAIYKCRNGELLTNPEAMNFMHQLADEINLVAIAAEKPKMNAIDMAVSVARATSDNFSSMYKDIQQGRRTEIDQINGYICYLAREFGMSVPKHQWLCERIHAISSEV